MTTSRPAIATSIVDRLAIDVDAGRSTTEITTVGVGQSDVAIDSFPWAAA